MVVMKTSNLVNGHNVISIYLNTILIVESKYIYKEYRHSRKKQNKEIHKTRMVAVFGGWNLEFFFFSFSNFLKCGSIIWIIFFSFFNLKHFLRTRAQMLSRLSINMFPYIFLKPNQILLWQLWVICSSSGLSGT